MALLAIGLSQSTAAVVGFDDLDGGTNRLSLSIVPDEVVELWGAGDMFGIRSRSSIVNGNGLPFAASDDSVVAAAGNAVFGGDVGGLVGINKPDNFFGAVDLTNPSNSLGSQGVAQWIFNVSGFSDMRLKVDVAAQGDFEASDLYSFSVQVDAGPVLTLLDFQADTAATHIYRKMDSGARGTENDPLVEQNSLRILDKSIQATGAFDTFIAPFAGSGSQVTLTFLGAGDGGGEAIAFDNIMILGVPEPSTFAMAGFGLFALAGLVTRRRKN